MRLSEQEVEAFFEDGFIVRPEFFDQEAVARMRAAFERLRQMAAGLRETCEHRGSLFVLAPPADASGSPRIDRIVWCGAAEPTLSELGQDPRLLRPVAQLLGSQHMTQLINQAHFKLPGDGLEFPWHQDSIHRRCGESCWTDVNGRGSYVQTVVAVDAMTLDNGPLQFIPGSGRLGHLGLPEGELPLDRLDPRTAVSVTLPPGGMAFFGPYVFHRSLPNESTVARRVFINGFASPGANRRVYPGCGEGRPVVAA